MSEYKARKAERNAAILLAVQTASTIDVARQFGVSAASVGRICQEQGVSVRELRRKMGGVHSAAFAAKKGKR